MSESIIVGSIRELTVAEAALADDAEFVFDDPTESTDRTLSEFSP